MVVFMDLYQYERELYKNGIKYIAGVDEVGRGHLPFRENVNKPEFKECAKHPRIEEKGYVL